MTGQVHDLRCVQKRLRWHASAQDAQPANLLATLNNNRVETFRRSGSRRCIPTTPAPYDCEIEIKLVSR